MDRDTRSASRLDGPDRTGWEARQIPVLPDSRLAGYRAAVDDLVAEVAAGTGSADPIADLLTKRLGEPEFAPVLSRLDGGSGAVEANLLTEMRQYRPNDHSSARDLPSVIRIFLLSQIDSAWWGSLTPFVHDADVLGSPALADLPPLRSAGALQFRYRTQPAGLPGRARDWAQRRALSARRPPVAGLRFTRARPAVIAAVNQVAAELAGGLPPRSPRLWVTSMARSVQHQHRLRALGYPAVLPSSHCVGYACDMEKRWFRRFDEHDLLARLLSERQDAGQLNVIDEGQAWHLCVSPLADGELTAAFDAQLGRR